MAFDPSHPNLLRLAANNLAYTMGADVTITMRYADGREMYEVCLEADAHAPVTPRFQVPSLDTIERTLRGEGDET